MAEVALTLCLPILEKLYSLVTAECTVLASLRHEIEWLRDELRSLRSLLRVAEQRDVEGWSWIESVRCVILDAEDVLDAFELVRSSHATCHPFHLGSRHQIASRIRAIRAALAEIGRRRKEYDDLVPASEEEEHPRMLHWLASTPLVCDADVVGLERDEAAVLERVVGGGEGLGVVSVVGMGGIGKTTLAKRVYNSPEVGRRFDRRAWVYVSQRARWQELLLEMAAGLLQMPTAEAAALGERELQRMLLADLRDKSYMVVFDDVWKQLWEAIEWMLPKDTSNKSRVIITTRKMEVAQSITGVARHIHELHPLPFEDSRALFFRKALPKTQEPPEELHSMADKIVRVCNGLPLAIVTIGSMISMKEQTYAEWQRVIDDIGIGSYRDNIRRVLLMSYKDLSFPLKSCFLYCAVFPQDFEIRTKRLMRMWMAEGLINEIMGYGSMENVAERYLRELIGRCVLQVSKLSTSGRVKACRVHDLFHELCISISEERGLIKIYKDQNTRLDNSIHRISIQNSTWIQQLPCHPRSLFVFSTIKSYNFNQHLKNFNLLRVLDLKDSDITELPNQIGKLMLHLRYLDIQGTKLRSLPASLEGLIKLQTLDLRRTGVKELFVVKSLRHLCYLEMGQVGKGIQVPPGLGCLECLEVVTGLQVTDSIINEISHLTRLKKLAIEFSADIGMDGLCSSINKMVALSSLSIFSREGDRHSLNLQNISPPPNLLKLHLGGCMQMLPGWISEVGTLTKLRLGFSKLTDDPLPTLGLLPNLAFLQLYGGAYNGKQIICSKAGFKRLKVMILTELEELEDWVIEEGALPCINELWIMSCCLLKMIPEGFVYLTTIKMLRVVDMPESFLQRLDCSVGEDYSKVKDVPTLQILD